MGMPISSYAILNSLAEGEPNPFVREAIEGFNLFAFVLHAPEEHKDFDNELREKFDRLDHDTGDKLLFFALLNPYQQNLEYIRQRDYFKNLAFWQPEQIYNLDTVPKPNDYSTTLSLLTDTLNIPYEELPCIVVTPSLQLREFHWFKTSSALLNEQLSELGSIASSPYYQFEHIHDYSIPMAAEGPNLGKIINDRIPATTESLEQSLAKALSAVLSFAVLGDSGMDERFKRIAEGEVKETLLSLLMHIKRLKLQNDDEEKIPEEFDDLCISITKYLSMLYSKEQGSNGNILLNESNIHCFEESSAMMLRSAEKAINLFGNDTSHNHLISSIYEDDYDYTPGLICLGKVFENEMNLSLVHWIRYKLGIEFPEYYNRYQENLVVEYTPDTQHRRPVNFNRGNQYKWFPPGIGESEIVVKELARRSLPMGFDEQTWLCLETNWRYITYQRNRAAHSAVIKKQEMFQMRNKIKELIDNGIFENTHRMKLLYQGHIRNPDIRF